MTSSILSARADRDNGFTLVEILVVIIIIGILAAVAIPIFLNQQRAARDSATIADVRSLAISVETAMVKSPEATIILPSGAATAASAQVNIRVGKDATEAEQATRIRTAKTPGTVIVFISSGMPGAPTDMSAGEYMVLGWNADGKEHTERSSAVVYDSANGGIQ